MYYDLYTIMILMFSNSQIWTSIVGPDQIASEEGTLITVYTICHSVCRHYFMAIPYWGSAVAQW